MARVVQSNFQEMEIAIHPAPMIIEIEDVVRPTLARNLVWSDDEQRWKMQRADVQGNLIVGTTGSKVSSLTYSAATVGTTATQILAANTSRLSVLIRNYGDDTVFLGSDSSVTTADGMPLRPGESFSDDQYTGTWYGISATSGQDVRAMEF